MVPSNLSDRPVTVFHCPRTGCAHEYDTTKELSDHIHKIHKENPSDSEIEESLNKNAKGNHQYFTKIVEKLKFPNPVVQHGLRQSSNLYDPTSLTTRSLAQIKGFNSEHTNVFTELITHDTTDQTNFIPEVHVKSLDLQILDVITFTGTYPRHIGQNTVVENVALLLPYRQSGNKIHSASRAPRGRDRDLHPHHNITSHSPRSSSTTNNRTNHTTPLPPPRARSLSPPPQDETIRSDENAPHSQQYHNFPPPPTLT
jgi:hypothetical protein